MTPGHWPPKRVVALLLTIVLAGSVMYTWLAGVGDSRTLWLLVIGVVLGATYTIRGSSLPPFLYRLTGSHLLAGNAITDDDDPRNLSPKVYLSVLLLVALVALMLYWHYARRR